MSAAKWEDRWEGTAWDEYTELVATIADECVPTRIPIDEPDFRYNLASDVVLLVTRDAEMRALLEALLANLPARPPVTTGND